MLILTWTRARRPWIFRVTACVKQAWFLGLLGVFAVVIVAQASRIIRGAAPSQTTAPSPPRSKSANASRRSRIGSQATLVASSGRDAEVATNVLHNVGNVLNNVTVSGPACGMRPKSPLDGLPKLAELVAEHAQEPNFLAAHEKGDLVPPI